MPKLAKLILLLAAFALGWVASCAFGQSVYRNCDKDDVACNMQNSEQLERDRGWKPDHGCPWVWAWSGKQCLINFPIADGGREVSSCKSHRNTGAYPPVWFVKCVMPVQKGARHGK